MCVCDNGCKTENSQPPHVKNIGELIVYWIRMIYSNLHECPYVYVYTCKNKSWFMMHVCFFETNNQISYVNDKNS